MKAKFVSGALFLFLSCATAVSAQMVVHGVVGTVKAVHPHDIVVAMDNSGSASEFQTEAMGQTPIKFEAELRADAMDVSKVQKLGDCVVVYYYGFGSDARAVAVKDLGPATYTKVQGTVTAYDKQSRKLTMTDDSGKQVTAQLDEHLVVDTDMGVVSGKKFAPHKGDHVRVTLMAGATPTVTFLHESL